jgi:hypothetical protein
LSNEATQGSERVELLVEDHHVEQGDAVPDQRPTQTEERKSVVLVDLVGLVPGWRDSTISHRLGHGQPSAVRRQASRASRSSAKVRTDSPLEA